MCFGGNPRIGFLKGRPHGRVRDNELRPTMFSLLAYKTKAFDRLRRGRKRCFCVRFVFSQGELMTEGGWAGVKVAPASEEA